MWQCGQEETALTQRLHYAVLCLARHEDRCLEYMTHQVLKTALAKRSV